MRPGFRGVLVAVGPAAASVSRADAVHGGLAGGGFTVRGVSAGQPVRLAAHLGGAALRRLGELGYPRRRLVLRHIGQLGGLLARDLGGLLHRRALCYLRSRLLHLLVAFAARPRADDVADGEPYDEY